VGQVVGVADAANALLARLRERMKNIVTRAPQLTNRPTVAGIEWIDPLMTIGNWMPELVSMAGGVNLFGEPGKHSPWMTWEQLRQADPEVMIVLPCGYGIARTRQDLPVLTEKPEWRSLRAARHGRVYVADGNQFFNRPGPRLVESLEILAEVIHPDAFRFGHERIGWEHL
jgi:iron complex transport system substrate-binding protein